MNPADSLVDVDFLRQRAQELELRALHADDSPVLRVRVAPALYAKARALRAEASAIEARIHVAKQLTNLKP